MANPTLIDRIREAARALSGKSGGDMQSVKIAGLASESFDNLIKNLTPKKLRTILDAADSGDILEQHRLFADAEDSDEHLFTELSKRRRALLSLDWQIMPAVTADASHRKKAEGYAEIVRGLFDSIPDFEDTIFDMADAVGHGFSALEIEWGLDGTFHVPQGLHYRPQTYFMLAPETRELRLRSSQGERDGIPLLPLGWIIHKHKSKSGWLPRYGLFRVVMGAWLLKSYARNGFAEFLEIHGLPFRVGKYPINATEQEKKDLLKGLAALGRDAAGIIPTGMEIEFKEAVKASERPFSEMISHCEKGMSKAILGGTLTTQADGRTSTNALGVIHEEVRHDLLVSDAVQIASTLTKQLLLPLAVLNCNLDDPKLAPWFRFDTSEAEDLLQLAEAIPKLTPVMRIPAKWAHEKTRIPMPEEGEEVLEVRAGAAPAGPDDDPGDPDEPEGPAGKAKPAEKTPKEKEKDKEAGARADVPGAVALAARDQDKEQEALDAAMDAVAPDLQAHMESMLAPLMAEARDGLPPDALMARLGALYPALDTAALEEHMARVMFVCELWGRVNGKGQ
jgi:phage gp29-like protein